MITIVKSLNSHIWLSVLHARLHVGGDKDKAYKVIVGICMVLAAIGLPLLIIILDQKNVMNGWLFALINLIGVTVFGFIGLGVWYLISERYWNSGKYGPYDLPLWVEGITLYFVLLWGGVIATLMLTICKPESIATYTISISW